MPISSVLGSSALLPAGLGFRNVLINGGMDVWQRGTGSIAPANGVITNTDRWVHTGNTTTFTQQTDVPAGFRYSLGVSGSDPSFAQKIEAANSARLASQTVTFSIWAKSISGSTSLFVNFYYPSAVDNFASLTTISSTTIATTVSSSWARYTLTVNLPANVINGLMVLVGRSSGSSNTYFTGVQLEQNYQPTPFEQRPIGTELQLCQRYYEKSYLNEVAVGTNTTFGLAVITGSTDANGYIYASIPMKVSKRISAPQSQSSNNSVFKLYTNTGTADQVFYYRNGANGVATTTCGTNNVGQDNISIYVYTGAAAWVPAYIVFHWVYNAEL
jgi:hypothetical protein